MDRVATARQGEGKRAVFFDRDGILNEMVYDANHGLLDSPSNADQVRLVSGAAEALCQLRALGYCIIVVTNQPGLAKGTLDVPRLNAIHQRLADMLKAQGARWDALYYCPHHPKQGGRPEYARDCPCRKPKPGMLLKAAQDLGLDLRASWMVGDGIVDIEAGRAAGCRTVLVTRLKLEQIDQFIQRMTPPDCVVPRMAEVAAVIQPCSCPPVPPQSS